MIRSVSICVALCRRKISANETRRLLRTVLPVLNQDVVSRQFHLTANVLTDNENGEKPAVTRRKSKGDGKDKRRPLTVSEEMKMAAVGAAQSLPGDWTRTAEELLDRLQKSNEAPVQAPEVAREQEEKKETDNQMPLLSTMKVARSFIPLKRKYNRDQGQDDRRGRKEEEEEEDEMFKRDERMTRRKGRRHENFDGLFKVPRLGVFDAEKLKKEGEQQAPSSEPEDLWVQLDKERMWKVKGGLPNNLFEEMAQWTREGKLWVFPIDNEADMHEERKYKFHDHVFLEHYLSVFPDKGPIRKFMEIVVIALGQNAFLTVPEKMEHIRWFAEYFREKQSVITSAIGEQGIMKEGEVKLEDK